MGKKISCLLCVILCVLGCGCDRKEPLATEPATDAAVTVATGPAISVTGQTVLPAGKAEGRATAFRNSTVPSGAAWDRDLVADGRYIFYANETHIIRLDRVTKEEKVIAGHKKEGEVSLCLDGKFLYYVDDEDVVYKVGINGGGKERVITRSMLKQAGYTLPYIKAVRIHRGVMYIHTNYSAYIIRYFPEKGKTEEVESAVYQSVFYKDSLYYIDECKRSIYRIDLRSMKKETVRKDPDRGKEGFIYEDLLCAGGKLYYLRGDKNQIFCYSEEGKDKPVGEGMEYRDLVAGTDDRLYYRCYPEDGDYGNRPAYLGVFDGHSHVILSLMPDDVEIPALVVGNVLYYMAAFRDENGVSIDMDYYYYKECSWKN